MHRDPPRTGPRRAIPADNTGLVAVTVIAALVVFALLAFWPRGESTNTAMRDSSPRVERTPTPTQPNKPQ